MSIDCLEFRRRVGAEPETREPAVLEHKLQCRACAEFSAEQSVLDRRLADALRIPVPEDLKARVIWRQAGRQRNARRWLPIAASLVLATGLGFVLMDSAEPLPAAVIAHIEHEPDLLLPTAALAEPVRVSAVLARGRVRLAQPMANIAHAGLCPFRGKNVPHLVLTIEGEPVSVLLLSDEQTEGSTEINEEGYHGVIVGSGKGSIAIVAPRPELLQPAREQLEQSVRWGI